MPAGNANDQVLLGVLAHELRNGLAPLRLAREVVRVAGADAARVQKATGILDRQLERMVRVVDDAYDISLLVNDGLELQRERIDLRYLISQKACTAVPAAEYRNISLRAIEPPQAMPADVDPGRLLQALDGLLNQAILASARGGEVTLCPLEDRGQLTVRIRYTGQHEVSAAIARIAAGLPNADASYGTGEMGIELMLALRLIHLHGGTVESAWRDAEAATDLIVRLPCVGHAPVAALGAAQADACAPPVSGPELAASARPTLPPGDSARPHIILADDNADLREYVASLLAEHWDVSTFGDGAAALEAARRRVPDLVLTDVVMPGLDGFGLLRALREDAQTRAVPVIMLSARSAEEARVQGLDAGADDYLVKPFGAQELLARVRTHLDIARLRREAVEAAKHDPLTGLANRAQGYAFAESIFARARRSGTQAAVLVIDLDRFKPINDTYGHDVGDSVLQEVARRLKASLRGEDVVARLGGDEFLAVLSSIRNGSDAANACRHIIASLELPIRVRDLQLRISPSIGISIFPRDGSDISLLAKNADMAMYHAKQNGRNTFHFFTEELDRRAARTQRIEARLRHSMDQQEFELNYQPIVDLSTRRVEGVEALLRWPAAGIGPEEFIPIAEMSGVIEQLGEWAMRECCRQVRSWQQAGLPRMTLSINVSPLQFRQPSLLPAITHALEKHDLDPGDIQLELTETALLHDEADAIAHMRAIKDYGLKLALDDFGRGYSSLHYIGRLPLDTIKVDQSFVRNLDVDLASAAVTDAVIAIGRSLGLSVVAEGIESAQVLRKLQDRNCHRVQGNFICPPLPADQLVGWYRRWTAQ
jgi:diguanylate cyclase (GGDEF)-like protein